jgi:hypothetical protein
MIDFPARPQFLMCKTKIALANGFSWAVGRNLSGTIRV